MFTAIALSAGLLAGLALRAAMAALSGRRGRLTATTLVVLAAVLAVTCMTGRFLLAGALGVSSPWTDWFVLFGAMAAGMAVGELLYRLGRAGHGG